MIGYRARLLTLRSRGRVRVGPAVDVAPRVKLSVAPGARVLLEEGCSLGEGVVVDVRSGEVLVAAGAVVEERAVIRCRTGIAIGQGTVVGAWACLDDSAPTTDDVERPIREQPVGSARIVIGEGARIAMHAVLGAGTTIAPGAAVGPYAVNVPRLGPIGGAAGRSPG